MHIRLFTIYLATILCMCFSVASHAAKNNMLLSQALTTSDQEPFFPVLMQYRSWLEQGNYAALDSALRNLMDGYGTRAQDDWGLYGFINHIVPFSKKREQQIAQWVAHSPDEEGILTIQCIDHTKNAYDARTSKLAKDVTDEEWEAAAQYVQKARPLCLRVLEQNPHAAFAYASLLDLYVLAGASDLYENLAKTAFAQAPYSHALHDTYRGFLQKRWGGTLQEAIAFSAQVREKVSIAPYLAPYADTVLYQSIYALSFAKQHKKAFDTIDSFLQKHPNDPFVSPDYADFYCWAHCEKETKK